MEIVDRAVTWNPVPDDRPCRVWLPAHPAPAGGQAAASRAPRSVTLTLTPQQADALPHWLSWLLSQQGPRPGDRVTVDLARLQSVHLTGLQLLMAVLWRLVGTHGDVLLTGGSRGLRAQLDSLDIGPASCRTAVYGAAPVPADRPAPVPAPTGPAVGPPRPAQLLPQQRQSHDVVGPGGEDRSLRTDALDEAARERVLPGA